MPLPLNYQSLVEKPKRARWKPIIVAISVLVLSPFVVVIGVLILYFILALSGVRFGD